MVEHKKLVDFCQVQYICSNDASFVVVVIYFSSLSDHFFVDFKSLTTQQYFSCDRNIVQIDDLEKKRIRFPLNSVYFLLYVL
jgi:hypothetical protein